MSTSNVQIRIDSGTQAHEPGCDGRRLTDTHHCGPCRQIRAARSEQVPERPAHFTWLQGPAEKPDPEPVSHAEHLQNRVAHWRQERGIA